MPQAFLSYTHLDDEFYDGYITGLRRGLEFGVRVASGDNEFSIFQDKEGIVLGEDWPRRLERAVSEASVFIPILTPSYLKSAACRRELEQFLICESRIGGANLVLPIYFVSIHQRGQVQSPDSDKLAQELFRRQHYDWREHADKPLKARSTRRAIKALASAIADVVYPRAKTPFQQGVESAVRDLPKEPSEEVEEIPGDFNSLTHLLDWQKFHHAVGTWAAYHAVPNPFDMGPRNFLRCLFDLGIPGGRQYDLEYEGGKLAYR
jgi:hypothetical protein